MAIKRKGVRGIATGAFLGVVLLALLITPFTNAVAGAGRVAPAEHNWSAGQTPRPAIGLDDPWATTGGEVRR